MKAAIFSLISITAALLFSLMLGGCTIKKGELGSAGNPIKLYFLPSVDARVIEASSKHFKVWLEQNTPYKFEVSIPQSFIAVVEAFGSNRADVASINTFGYILANEKYGATAGLTVIRHGASTYRSQFLARADGAIKKLEDLNGKQVAFVDPVSTSGFLLPKKILNDRGIKPAKEIFAMKHDSVVSMIYTGQADAGATFFSPEADGEIQDARRLVKTQYPDVEQKVKIIELTDEIPNDPIIFRKGIPEEMRKTLIEAFVKYVGTAEGRESFNKVFGVTELKPAVDADYDKVRLMLKSLGKSASEVLKK